MAYIFETPDGGLTVYRRLVGTSDKQLVSQAPVEKTEWEKIQELAAQYPTLQEAVDQMMVVYHLSRDHVED